jgi:hypothetical protein
VLGLTPLHLHAAAVSANVKPTIVGTPLTKVNVGSYYRFAPIAYDYNKDPLLFSIVNKPDWATFDPNTGVLSGTPSSNAAGINKGILIGVTDNHSSVVNLRAFDLSVIQPNRLPEISGSPLSSVNVDNYYSFKPYAKDADNDSLRFSIINKPVWALFDTKTGILSGIPRKNHLGTTSNIKISVTDNKSSLVYLSAFGIEVTKKNTAPLISGIPKKQIETGQVYLFKPQASDSDGDSLTFSITNKPTWLNFDEKTGQLSGSPTVQELGSFKDITLYVTDNKSTPVKLAAFTLTVTKSTAPVISALETALKTGDAKNVTSNELLDAGINLAQSQLDSCKATLKSLYPNGLETTSFPVRSAYYNSTSSVNIPLHINLSSAGAKVYSWIGTKETGNRYAVLGTNVFSFTGVNTDLKNNTLNLLKWLFKNENTTDILNQKLTILAPNAGDKTAFNDWLKINGLSSQWVFSTDTNLLNTGGFDLYLADITRSTAEIKTALASKKPVLVFNNWYQPSDLTLAEFDLTWNWYGANTIGNVADINEQCEKSSSTSSVLKTLSNLKQGLPNFLYNDVNCVDTVGRVDCDTSKVLDDAGNSVDSLFMQGANTLRDYLKALDKKSVNIFSLSDKERLYKIAVLLGDKYREAVSFPMDKINTEDNAFYRSLFADYTVHSARPNNPYQADVGDFSQTQLSLNTALTQNATRSYTPTTFDEWTSTGLYLPPGKAITITRTDNSPTSVKVKFNYQRETTWLWNKNKYSRPRYMASAEINLNAGQTYTLSSPYGGPIYIGWLGVATDALPFKLEFSNVLENPLLENFETTAIDTFSAQVKDTKSNWIDIKTPYAELHTLKANMLNALDRQDGQVNNGYTSQDVQDYVNDLNNYLIAGNYAYAGFTGIGLPKLSDETQKFCQSFGLTEVNYGGLLKNLCTDEVIHAKPRIQHINSDINATNGALCSGNPFDSGSSIRPLDWGENHEMGHNLQRTRLKIYNGRSTEVSNNIFPLHTQWKWTVASVLTKHPSQTRPANSAAFGILQAAIKAGKAADANHPLWVGSGTYDNAFERLSFYMQLAYTQQSWEIYTKLYIMDRILSDAVKDTTDAKWNAVKTKLGLSNYSRSDANNLNGNDFMYLAVSNIAGKDYSYYFQVWGIEVSAAAKAQIAANNISESVPAVFYYVDNELPAIMPSLADAIPLDGTSTWADPTP